MLERVIGLNHNKEPIQLLSSNQYFIPFQVVFPDFTRQLFKPKPADFRHFSKMKHRLVTKVMFSHSTWSGGLMLYMLQKFLYLRLQM